MRLFVHRADLAPVARQHHVVTFPDGASITVEPGAPIVPIADGHDELEIGRLRVVAALPAGLFPFTADHVEARGDRTRFPIEDRCAALVIAVPASAVTPYEDRPDGGMAGDAMGGRARGRGKRRGGLGIERPTSDVAAASTPRAHGAPRSRRIQNR